jgi:hypothetical protein
MATALPSLQSEKASSYAIKRAKIAPINDRATRFRNTCSTLVQQMPNILRLLTYQQQVQHINELRATITTLDSTTAKEAQMKSTLFWALVKVNDEVERRKQ